MLYAVDGDNDNLIDVADSVPDALASAANYLSQVGWHAKEPAMLEVQLPDGFDWKSAQLSVRKSIDEWSQLGVRALHVDVDAPGINPQPQKVLHAKTDKSRHKSKNKKSTQAAARRYEQSASMASAASTVSLDKLGLDVKGPAAILLPQGYRGPAFMVFDNFDVIMDWNRSVNYALSVAELAEQLRHDARIIGGQSAEGGALSFQEMLDLQSMLNARGFKAGEPDGLPGFNTQAAVREYQLASQLPADGYASRSIYQRLSAAQHQ